MIKKKKIHVKNIGTSFDRLVNYSLNASVDISDQMLEIADSILANCPVLINFDTIDDVGKCDHVLAFLSGVIYAIQGEAYQIGKELYLIASEKAFEDGSLHKWVKDHVDNE